MREPKLRTRLAEPSDEAALAALFHAVDLHYWGAAAPSREAMAEHVRRNVLGARSCEIAIAELDGKPVGLATFALLFPAPGPAGQLYMKDLFAWPRHAAAESARP